jgi:hypothetical protein
VNRDGTKIPERRVVVSFGKNNARERSIMNNYILSKGSKRTESEGNNLFFLVGMIICILLLQASLAAAEEERLPDRFMLRLGGYRVQNANTIVRLDANNLPVGAYIDFNETLGGEKTGNVARLDGFYRFNEKHGLGFSWYSLKFTGSRVLEEEIDWAGQPYPIGAKVDSELNFDVYKLSYQYSLFHNEKVELAASFGFHVMRTFVGINSSIPVSQSGSEAITAPLPVFGLSADYNFTPRFSAFYNYQWFFINYQDKAKGGIQDFLIGLEYRLFRHVSLGAAYNRFALHLDMKGDDTTLFLDTNWNGGMLYGAVYF